MPHLRQRRYAPRDRHILVDNGYTAAWFASPAEQDERREVGV
jgi:hypothetical protein